MGLVIGWWESGHVTSLYLMGILLDAVLYGVIFDEGSFIIRYLLINSMLDLSPNARFVTSYTRLVKGDRPQACSSFARFGSCSYSARHLDSAAVTKMIGVLGVSVVIAVGMIMPVRLHVVDLPHAWRCGYQAAKQEVLHDG